MSHQYSPEEIEKAQNAMTAIRHHLDMTTYALRASESAFAEVAGELAHLRRAGGAELKLIERLDFLQEASATALSSTAGFYDEALAGLRRPSKSL
jgi:hypothetical protein